MSSIIIRTASVMESLRHLPERVSVDEIIERIIVIAKLKYSMEQAASGNILSHDLLINQAKEWIKR